MGNAMNPLSLIYWTKALLGVAVGLLTALLSGATASLSVGFNLLNAISVAILIYIISYYIYKRLFFAKVGKTTKILSTGIGAYFFTWLVVFGLFFTLFTPVLVVTSPSPDTSFKAGDSVTISARISNQFGAAFSGANVTTVSPLNTTIHFDPTAPGTYVATYNITSSDPVGDWKITVIASIDTRSLQSPTITVHIIASS